MEQVTFNIVSQRDINEYVTDTGKTVYCDKRLPMGTHICLCRRKDTYLSVVAVKPKSAKVTEEPMREKFLRRMAEAMISTHKTWIPFKDLPLLASEVLGNEKHFQALVTSGDIVKRDDMFCLRWASEFPLTYCGPGAVDDLVRERTWLEAVPACVGRLIEYAKDGTIRVDDEVYSDVFFAGKKRKFVVTEGIVHVNDKVIPVNQFLRNVVMNSDGELVYKRADSNEAEVVVDGFKTTHAVYEGELCTFRVINGSVSVKNKRMSVPTFMDRAVLLRKPEDLLHLRRVAVAPTCTLRVEGPCRDDILHFALTKFVKVVSSKYKHKSA